MIFYDVKRCYQNKFSCKTSSIVYQSVDYMFLWMSVRVSWDVCTRYKRDSGCFYEGDCFLIFSDDFSPLWSLTKWVFVGVCAHHSGRCECL